MRGGGVRCGLPGKRGLLRPAMRLPTADSLCSLKVARASRISGRKFSAAARQNPARLHVCRNGCAEMHRDGAQWIFPRRAPFGRKESPPWTGVPPEAVCPRLPERPYGTPPPPRSAAPFPIGEPSRCVPEGGKDRKDSVFRFLSSPESRALFSQQVANGNLPRSPARGYRAVPVGAPFEG